LVLFQSRTSQSPWPPLFLDLFLFSLAARKHIFHAVESQQSLFLYMLINTSGLTSMCTHVSSSLLSCPTWTSHSRGFLSLLNNTSRFTSMFSATRIDLSFVIFLSKVWLLPSSLEYLFPLLQYASNILQIYIPYKLHNN